MLDCLNFGNPERPEIGWELARAIDGLPVPDGNARILEIGAGTGSLTRSLARHGTVTATIAQVLHKEPAPPSQLRPELPPALDAVVAKCLAKRPEDRYPDARRVAQDLREGKIGEAAARDIYGYVPSEAGAEG